MPNPSSRRVQSWGAFLRFWIPVALLMLLVFLISTKFVEPAPPKHAVIITGSKEGQYYAVAQKYAEMFKANGIDLEVRPSAGSVENWSALLKEDGDVDLAIVQGGTEPDGQELDEKV